LKRLTKHAAIFRRFRSALTETAGRSHARCFVKHPRSQVNLEGSDQLSAVFRVYWDNHHEEKPAQSRERGKRLADAGHPKLVPRRCCRPCTPCRCRVSDSPTPCRERDLALAYLQHQRRTNGARRFACVSKFPHRQRLRGTKALLRLPSAACLSQLSEIILRTMWHGPERVTTVVQAGEEYTAGLGAN
jgi:hypothetical protein